MFHVKLIVLAILLPLTGCAALMQPQRSHRTLPSEIISELSDAGCQIQWFRYGQSQRQGERVEVRCAAREVDTPRESGESPILLLQ